MRRKIFLRTLGSTIYGCFGLVALDNQKECGVIQSKMLRPN